jgi:hypothetical protein
VVRVDSPRPRTHVALQGKVRDLPAQRGPVLVGRPGVDATLYARALDLLFRLRKPGIGAGEPIRPAEGGAERHPVVTEQVLQGPGSGAGIDAVTGDIIWMRWRVKQRFPLGVRVRGRLADGGDRAPEAKLLLDRPARDVPVGTRHVHQRKDARVVDHARALRRGRPSPGPPRSTARSC